MVIISILYFHYLVYINKSMLLICASPYRFWGGIEKSSGDRTAGLPVQHHIASYARGRRGRLGELFGLVNITQPQNCTRSRRLVWTSFFLCVTFLIYIFYVQLSFLICGTDWERSALLFHVWLLNWRRRQQQTLRRVHFWMMIFFGGASFHFDICTDPPYGKTIRCFKIEVQK